MKTISAVLSMVSVLLLLAVPFVSAATITGTVYDFDLTEVKGAVVEIDTIPRQQVVARDALYTLNVPAGSYTLIASRRVNGTITAETSEKITVAQDGSYTLDLILFPSFEDDTLGDELIDPDEELATLDEGMPWFVYAGVALLIAVAGAWFVLGRKRKGGAPSPDVVDAKKATTPDASKNQASKEDLEQLLAIIKRLGGRTTQKELRKEMPYSEAKVSLMLTELEHAGRLQKIKRGRANIIILR